MGNIYRINVPNIISEPMELEQVVIDLKTGCYYNLNESAAQIWRMIEFGYSKDEIIQGITKISQNLDKDNVFLIEEFIKKLEEEELIIENKIDIDRKPKEFPISELKFEVPTYQKFDDMQEMLLLDPIHEVSEAGWPNLKDEKDL